MTDATVTNAEPTPGHQARYRGSSPPRWWFHSLLALPALALLWSQSVPGDDLLWLLLGFLGCVVMGIIWLTRLTLCLEGGGRPRSWLLVAPAMGVAVIALGITDAPLRLRFELSRSDLNAAVAALPQDARTGGDVGEVGSYEITYWWRARDGVILNEAHGSGITNDAGFAYLPDGPTPGLANPIFESPQFTALGDGWYAWTASW